MTSFEKYREADYDVETYFDKTTSWPDGLHEIYRFEPNLPRAVRRISSAEDIQRYKDHFCIVQKNQGGWFTWKHYLKVLGDDLRHFDTLILMSKALLEHFSSPRDSEVSQYVTASESDFLEKPLSKYETCKSRIFDNGKSFGDADSVSSMADISINSSIDGTSINSNVSSFTPRKNLLKKFCSEIRLLASKTMKTVEKMKARPKYCSSCGDYICSGKLRKECSHSSLKFIASKKPLMPSMLKANSLTRILSESVTSITCIGSGEFTTNPQSAEQVAESSKKSFDPKNVAIHPRKF